MNTDFKQQLLMPLKIITTLVIIIALFITTGFVISSNEKAVIIKITNYERYYIINARIKDSNHNKVYRLYYNRQVDPNNYVGKECTLTLTFYNYIITQII